MTEQGIGLLSPIGPCRLSLLKGNCQISEPNGGRRAHFYPFPFFFFVIFIYLFICLFSSVLLWRLFSPLCLWRVEAVDEGGSIILGFLFFFLRRLGEAGFGFIQCRPFGRALCCFCPPPNPPIPDSSTILCFVNGCL